MKKFGMIYLLNFPVPPLLYQSFVPYIIIIFIFFLPRAICFFLRVMKEEGCMWEWWGERIREVSRIFFSVLIECVFILTPCNINVISALIIMNNIRKELVMIVANYEYQIAANQSTKSIIINNKSEHKINPN